MTIETEQPEMPQFFKGMACAYEDAAQFIENMRDNLPGELSFMKDGLNTIAQGFRAKIDALVVTVSENMARAASDEGSMEQ